MKRKLTIEVILEGDGGFDKLDVHCNMAIIRAKIEQLMKYVWTDNIRHSVECTKAEITNVEEIK